METPARRPYERPRLTVFGDLRVVTQTNASQNMNDPGNSSTSRT
ncbi:MAG TPA: lasso RiPP family leader peptide-containing protein [Longimicrobium sp.]|nr:lasso RiPP family leader peptide-containing protein [Longimicrobium sp.]